MRTELITVGTEILMGNIVNTNAQYLSEKLTALGFPVYYQSVVGDNPDRLRDAIKEACRRSDLLILTGGLGPTEDDITRDMAAEVFGMPLLLHEPTKAGIEAYFDRTGRTPTKNNFAQAMVPEGAAVLDNENGTAPGLILTSDARAADAVPEGRIAILLPGPPNELIPMFEEKVIPFLKTRQNSVIVSSMVKECGIGESEAETRVLDLIDGQTNPTIASYAKTGEVHFRVTASAESEEKAEELLVPVVNELKKRFQDAVFTTRENETLEDVLVKELSRKNLTVSTAESCTAGMVAERIVNVPGASDVFSEGFVTYSNEAKHELLGVSKETLEKYGAVSEQTAKEMAAGAKKAAKADLAIAVTGLAGPSGGTEDKPVGLVYLACAAEDDVRAERHVFNGNREKIRTLAATSALDLARRTAESMNKKESED